MATEIVIGTRCYSFMGRPGDSTSRPPAPALGGLGADMIDVCRYVGEVKTLGHR